MKKSLAILALGTVGALSHVPAFAADPAPERVSHYEAQKGESIEQTIAILLETNAKLKELLAGEMGEYDIHDIHSLSYTLEDSLMAIANEVKQLHGTVADMHFASEGQDRDAVIDYGKAYLSGVEKIIK